MEERMEHTENASELTGDEALRHSEGTDGAKSERTGLESERKRWRSRLSGIVTRDLVLALAKGICLFALALLLDRCEIIGARPFGIALLCGAESGLAFLYGGLFVSALPILSGAFRPIAIVAATAAVLLRVAARMTIDLPWDRNAEPRLRTFGTFAGALFREHVALRMTVAAISAFLMGLYAMIAGGFRVYDLFGALLGVIAAPLGALLYAAVFRDESFTLRGTRRTVTATLFCAVLVLALADVSFYRIGLAPALALGVTLWLAHRKGIAVGILAGLLLGMCVDPVTAPLYAFGAIASGGLKRISVFMGALSAFSVGMAWGLYVYGLSALSRLLPALLAAAMLFAVLERLGFLPGCACDGEEHGDGEPLPESEEARDDRGDGEDGGGEIRAYREERIRRLESALAAERLRDEERRIENLCGSFLSISELLSALSEDSRCPSVEEFRRVCDRVCDEFCPGCASCAVCWGSEYARMAALLGRMAEELRRGGRVDERLLPDTVRERCRMSGAILLRINEEAGLLIAEAEKREKAGVLSADYGAAAALFRSASRVHPEEYAVDEHKSRAAQRFLAENGVTPASVAVSGGARGCLYLWGVSRKATERLLRDGTRRAALSEVLGFLAGTEEYTAVAGGGGLYDLRLPAAPRYRMRSASVSRVARRNGKEEGLCGDSCAIFECGDGRCFALLSDGMGSGRSAAHLSGICTVFLQRMLSSGGDTGVILRMLNDFLVAGAEGESSATVDLLEFDRYTGEAFFWKSGAAPTFVLREGNLFRLSSRTAPAGILPEADVQKTAFRLYAGDVVAMVSDGISDGAEDFELQSTLLGGTETDEGLLRAAERIADGISAGAGGDGTLDDRSVILVAIERCGEERDAERRAG